MSTYTIGIDIGTTGTKTVLFDVEQGIIAQVSRDATLFSEQAGYAEADTRQWYTNVVESIREILSTHAISPEKVVAIATSGMVPAVVALDVNGVPLRRAILQNDARASLEIERIGDELAGMDLVKLTGSALTQQSVAPTLEWLRQHEPRMWEKTVCVVGSYDWLLIALGAAPHLEKNWALESGLFTIAGEPVDRILAAAGADGTLLAPVLQSGDRAGSLSARAAKETGLREGTTLIVGGADHVLSAFAAGVEKQGDWLVKLGGAGDILVASDVPIV